MEGGPINLFCCRRSLVSVLKKQYESIFHIWALLLGIDEKATVPLGEYSSQVADTKTVSLLGYIHSRIEE